MLKEKSWICVLWTKRTLFERVFRKVLETAMRKKGKPQDLARSVMSLYEGAKTRVRVDSELSAEFEVKVWMHQGPIYISCGNRASAGGVYEAAATARRCGNDKFWECVGRGLPYN